MDAAAKRGLFSRGQRLSHSGSFGCDLPAENLLSGETFRIFESETTTSTLELLATLFTGAMLPSGRVSSAHRATRQDFFTSIDADARIDQASVCVLMRCEMNRPFDISCGEGCRMQAGGGRARAVARLRQAERWKRSGLAAVSHDFNMSAGGCFAYGEMLMRGPETLRSNAMRRTCSPRDARRALVEQY